MKRCTDDAPLIGEHLSVRLLDGASNRVHVLIKVFSEAGAKLVLCAERKTAPVICADIRVIMARARQHIGTDGYGLCFERFCSVRCRHFPGDCLREVFRRGHGCRAVFGQNGDLDLLVRKVFRFFGFEMMKHEQQGRKDDRPYHGVTKKPAGRVQHLCTLLT